MRALPATLVGIAIATTTSCSCPSTTLTLMVVDAGTNKPLAGVQATEWDKGSKDAADTVLRLQAVPGWPATDQNGLTLRTVPLCMLSEIEVMAPGYHDARIKDASQAFDPQVSVETPATPWDDGPRIINSTRQPVIVRLFRLAGSPLPPTSGIAANDTTAVPAITPPTSNAAAPAPPASEADLDGYWKNYIALMDEISTTLEPVKTEADARAVIPKVQYLGKQMAALNARGHDLESNFRADRLKAMSLKYGKQLEEAVNQAGREVDRIAGDPVLGKILKWDNQGFLMPTEKALNSK